MTKGKDGKGIKSALELAMEKFGAEEDRRKLTEEQKYRLAEVDRELNARIAEIEIMSAGNIARSREMGEAEAAEELERRKASEIGRASRQAEVKKKKIRTGE